MKQAFRITTHRFGRIASFRILLWWGVRTTMEILRIRRPGARTIREFRVSRMHLRFPVASWFLAGEKVYCIVLPEGRKEATIFAFDSNGKDMHVV